MAKRKPLVFIAGEIVESKATDTIEGNNIVVTATGSTEERLLKDRFSDFVNVKDFGAKGDGTTNDTAAFQAAKAAADQRNAVVYVPDGTYKVTEPVVGEFISFGHPTFVGGGSVTFLTDLYNDYVHKTKNVDESITGDKTFTGHTTFSGPTTNTGNESHSGTETHTGPETHKGTETHEGNETHGKAVGTTLTYHGVEIHDGSETHSGTEVHNGTETHNGPVTFTDTITLSTEALIALTAILLAAENNGFVDPTTLNGKLRIDPNEFIAANGGLSVSSTNNINKLKVNLSNANKALLANITPFLIKENGGLSIDSETNKIQSAVSQNLENVVFTTGAQSIDGAKTFVQGPFGTTQALTNNTINLAQGNVFTKTISANTTFTFSGTPANTAATFNLILINGGAYTITWPSSVKWEAGETPTFSTEGTDVLTFLTPNGGTTWYGTLAIRGAA